MPIRKALPCFALLLIAAFAAVRLEAQVVVTLPNKSTTSDSVLPPRLHVEVNGTSLELRQAGRSVRKFLFFKVYNVAHYLGEENVRALAIRYRRDIDVERIHDALKDGFKQNTNDEEWEGVAPEVEALLAEIDSDISEEDQLVMFRVGRDDTVFMLNGSQIYSVSSHLFGEVLWRIWLGDQSVVDRASLMGELSHSK